MVSVSRRKATFPDEILSDAERSVDVCQAKWREPEGAMELMPPPIPPPVSGRLASPQPRPRVAHRVPQCLRASSSQQPDSASSPKILKGTSHPYSPESWFHQVHQVEAWSKFVLCSFVQKCLQALTIFPHFRPFLAARFRWLFGGEY